LNEIIPQKKCSRCKQEFPATTEYFMLHKGSLYCHCHTCRKLDKKESHIRHKEHNNARSRRWWEENHDHYLQSQLDYAASHREEARLRAAKWYADNREYALKAAKETRDANPEKFRRKAKDYAAQNPLILNANKRAHKARKRAGGTHTRIQLMELYGLQDGRCGYCGVPIFWHIKGDVHIDHMEPVSRGGSNTIDNICLACMTCNKEKYNRNVSEWVLTRGW
jgi:hypothetical protein